MVEVDLHLHTTKSDGRLTPAEMLDFVVGRGLKVMSITDHDTTDGLEAACKAARAYPQLTFIPGVEFSTDIPGNEIHLLGYYIDYRDLEFRAALERFRESRVGRAKEMVRRLAALGLPVEWERVTEIAGGGTIGRPHIAQAMVEKGYISLPQQAFETYLGRNGLAYAEREKLTPEEAVQLVARVGGVPVLGHPARLDRLGDMLEKLIAVGLEGVEVYYADYDAPTIERLEEVAQRYDLLPCGGSDYHALGTPGECLPGEVGPPMEVVERLRTLAASRACAKSGQRT